MVDTLNLIYGTPVPAALAAPIEVTLAGRRCVISADDGDQLKQVMRESDGDVAADLEGFGLGDLAVHLKAVQVGHATRVVVLDPRHPRQHRMISWALREARSITMHNSTFDAPNLYRNGLIDLASLAKITDTLLYARLAWPDQTVRKGLADLSAAHLGVTDGRVTGLFAVNGWRSVAEGYRNADLDLPAYVVGAGLDVLCTAALRPILRAAALATLTTGHPFTRWGVTGADAQRLVEREQRINRMLLRRACVGLRIDPEYHAAYLDQVSQEQHAREQVLADAGVRPGVGQDLAAAALKHDGLADLMANWPRTRTGAYQMTKETVPALAARWPVAAAFAAHKEVSHVRKDYLDKLDRQADQHGRIHPVTNLLKAVTGRASMGDPPLHQFSDTARGMILADPGDTLVSIDWAQIEPVVMANVAGDADALRPYETDGAKFYDAVAARAGCTYKQAKVTLLAQLYGEGLPKLAASLGITEQDAADLQKLIFEALPQTKLFVGNRRLVHPDGGRLRRLARDHRQVFTLSGRILPIPMGRYDGRWSVAEHKAVNYFVQGSAYDLLAETLVSIEEAGLGDAVYLTMHDELVVSATAAPDIRRLMEIPPARLVELASQHGHHRVPVIHTDLAVMGERWKAV
jgi:DNA polymerase-1